MLSEHRPKYFEVLYGDPAVAAADRDPKDIELLTHAALKRRTIMPEGTRYTAPAPNPDIAVLKCAAGSRSTKGQRHVHHLTVMHAVNANKSATKGTSPHYCAFAIVAK